jgi:hypothetical protein
MITSRENGRRSEGHGWTAGLFLVIGFFMASLMGRVFAADMPLPGAEIIPSQVDEPSLSNQPENLTGTPQSAPNWRFLLGTRPVGQCDLIRVFQRLSPTHIPPVIFTHYRWSVANLNTQ